MIDIKYKGIEFTFSNGETYVLAPLAINSMINLGDKIKALSKMEGFDVNCFKSIVEITFHSLKRNYPDITAETIGDELVDMANCHKVFDVIMNIAGYIAKKNNGGNASGEIQAVS